MTTKKVNLSDYDPSSVPNGKPFTIGIVVAEWNPDITNAMLEGAYQTLLDYSVEESNIPVMHVPGSYELTTGAQMMLRGRRQGETRHFDFICEAVANGLTNLSIKEEKPVIFSLLTTNNMQQAIDRSGGKHGNKGIEGAVTALKMCRNAVEFAK